MSEKSWNVDLGLTNAFGSEDGHVYVSEPGPLVPIFVAQVRRHRDGPETTMKRARLVAAAPEMLRLIKDVFKYLQSVEEGIPPGAPSVEQFEMVIAKAEGRD